MTPPNKQPRLPRTIALEARVGLEDLATILDFLGSRGVIVNSKSELMRLALASFAAILQESGKASSYSFVQAYEFLARNHLLSIGRGTNLAKIVAAAVEEKAIENDPIAELVKDAAKAV